jgi:diaminohydroxyphosphoribosylaminopyrimidine deaminase/5-amino-6-(5-phosphoribosylamino)uracil reductase
MIIESAMSLAVERAREFRGATAPNPAVGAVALDAQGTVLSALAHQRAGTPHAEARVLDDCRERGVLSRIDTLVVTLEPCNHQGRTPPCTEAILAAGIRIVVYGAADPNPRVAGHGAQRLRAGGVEVLSPETLPPAVKADCADLLAPFAKWCTTGIPWVTVKTAHRTEGDEAGSMVPPAGSKTFTTPESLLLAHQLRKRSDALLTGSGTVLADRPEFTVRHVTDHPGKARWLVVLDRRKRTPTDWIRQAESRGFLVRIEQDWQDALKFLGSQGVLEVLVEAGPLLSSAILASDRWDEHVRITRQAKGPDLVEIRRGK